MADAFFTVLAILIVVALLAMALSGIRIVQPYEQGLWVVLGKYKGKLNPGFNWVYPLVSNVVKLDLRTQVLEVPQQEVITKDNSPANVDAIVYLRVLTPEKAFFEVTDYRHATLALGQTTLRSIIGDMDLDEILYNRTVINTKLRDILDEATTNWGVKVEAVEIRQEMSTTEGGRIQDGMGSDEGLSCGMDQRVARNRCRSKRRCQPDRMVSN